MHCRRGDPHLDPRRPKTGIQYRVPTLVASRFTRYRPRRARESQNPMFDGPRWTAATIRHVSSGASWCGTPVANLSASRVVRELLNQNWGDRIPRGSPSTLVDAPFRDRFRSYPERHERLFAFEKYGDARLSSATEATPSAFARSWGDRDITGHPYGPSERRAAFGAAIRADGPCSFTAKGITIRVAAR